MKSNIIRGSSRALILSLLLAFLSSPNADRVLFCFILFSELKIQGRMLRVYPVSGTTLKVTML